MTKELDFLELAHWIAAPMKDVGTIEQFHNVVERAEKLLSIAAHNGSAGLAHWANEELPVR